jgi:hypothetical protein
MRPVATKDKIKNAVDQFLATVTEETGPRRFHVTLRIGQDEHGVSVKCTPAGTSPVLTAYSSNTTLPLGHWQEAAPAAFLSHPWVGANVLQVIPSKVSEKDVKKAITDHQVCLMSYYEGSKFLKQDISDAIVSANFVTVIEVHQPSLAREWRTVDAIVATAWNNVIVNIMNRAWDTLCSTHLVRAANEAPKTITGYEKSQMSNAVRDAFSQFDVSSLKTLSMCLSTHIKEWLGVVCAPFLQRILAIQGDARLIISEIGAVSAQLDVLKPFMDAVFWSVDTDQKKHTNTSSCGDQKMISGAIKDGAREQLYQPCYRHISKAALDSIASCRTQGSLIGSVVSDAYFQSLKDIFLSVDYAKNITTPSCEAAKIFFSVDSQEIIAKLRSGDITPHEYTAHVLRQVKVERDIADALVYSFDSTLGEHFFAAYVGKSQTDLSALMKEVLETETQGIASIFEQLIAVNVDASDANQRSKLESLAILLAGANLPVPTTTDLPGKMIPGGSFEGVVVVVIRLAVCRLLDNVHSAFDTAVAADEQKQKDAAATPSEPSSGSTTSLLTNYITAMVETHRRLFLTVTALEEVLKSNVPLQQLLRGATGSGVWGKKIGDMICPTLTRGIGEGIAASLAKRAVVTSTRDQGAAVSKEVEVCIATFVDFACRGTIRDTDVEPLLADALAIGKYVVARDTLQLELQNRCVKRLLAKSTPDDLESTTINICKRIFGQHFVHKMERNLADIENRDKYTNAFLGWAGNQGRALDATYLVLAAGQWTLSAATPFAQPEGFQIAIDRFGMWFYSQREHSSKKLDWIMNESTGECIVEYPNRKEVSGPVSHIAVLLRLSGTGDTGLTLQQLCDCTLQSGNALNPDTRLGLMLKTVMDIRRCSKPPMVTISKPAAGKKYDGNQRVALAQKFAAPSRKFVIQAASATKRVTTTEELSKAREAQIDCAVVRIMKSRRTLAFRELYNEVVQQLVNHYNPVERDVKQRIEDLIQREYLKRDEDDATRLVYLA